MSAAQFDLDMERAVVLAARAREATAPFRSALIAVSGIDGSGKGFVSERLRMRLQADGRGVAVINVDGWLNLPALRFGQTSPAEHFYANAIRFDQMFAQLVLPLRDGRSIRVETDFAEETAPQFRKHLYEFAGVDVIVLEGIYLLKREFRPYYDLSFWVECSFATALERAVARAQEGLSPEATLAAYRSIYFPAQEVHIARDNPRTAATWIIHNDAARSSHDIP